MIFKDHIIIKFGKQHIASILFPIDLIADVVVNILSGNLSRVSACLDLLFDRFI